MKTLITLFICFSIPLLSKAQSKCNPYIPTEEGSKTELTHYDKKGKESGKIVYELIEKLETDDGLAFTVKAYSYDKKGKEVFNNEFKALCKDGKFEYDMAFKMSAESMQNYKNMDVDVDATQFELPSMNTEPGTELPDGSLVITVSGDSPIKINMTILVKERKVESREDVKTPAGTFNCIKISQKISTKAILKVEGSSVEWYAEGVGLVRSESYNKGGKLVAYSELTNVEK